MDDPPTYRYIPTICRHYNQDTCTRPDCTHPHVCFDFFNPKSFCKKGKECSFSHNIFDHQVKRCLRRAGFNVDVKPGDLRQAYVEALKQYDQTRQKSNPAAIVSGFEGLQIIDVPRPCLNFNSGLCNNNSCQLLHICKDYVEGICKNNFKTCGYGHDVYDPRIKEILRAAGFNVNQKPKDLMDDYRQALRRCNDAPQQKVYVRQKSDHKTPKRPPNMSTKSMSVVDLTHEGVSDTFVKENRSRNARSSSVDRRAESGMTHPNNTRRRQQQRRKKKPTAQENPPGPNRQIISPVGSSSDSADSTDEEDINKRAEMFINPVRKPDTPKQKQKEGIKPRGNPNLGALSSTSGPAVSPAGGASTKKPDPSKPRMSQIEDADICRAFIMGTCRHAHCLEHHVELPYLWQCKVLQKGWTWKSFSGESNQLLEQCYCNVATTTCPVVLEGQVFTVEFDKMTACTSDISVPVRRLSSASSASVGVKAAESEFSTTWVWYWESDDGWLECGLRARKMTKQEVQLAFEKAFEDEPNGQAHIKIDQDKFLLNFSEMHHTNIASRTVRNLRRRPLFISADDVKKTKREQKVRAQQHKTPVPETSSLPAEWAPMSDRDEVVLIDVPGGSTDFKAIRGRFAQTLPHAQIVLIKRIQNPMLWFTYNLKKSKMERESDGRLVTEMNLFHGTSPDAVNPICEQNFDWRLYGSSAGTRYGKGVYFAIHADKAHKYVTPDDGGLCFMFSARTLLGRFAQGGRSLRRPPPLDPANPARLYDSCTDDPKQPSIFVLFDKDQYYPEFIICYRVV